MDTTIDKLPVVIEDFKINRATILNKSENKTFIVSLGAAEGIFEIVEGKAIVATGKIHPDLKLSLSAPDVGPLDPQDMISGREMYNDLKVRGYQYGPDFQCLDEVNIEGTRGFVKWQDRWIPYLDAHLLFFGLVGPNVSFSLPTRVLSVKLNPFDLNEYIGKIDTYAESKRAPVVFDRDGSVCSSPGVEIRNMKLEPTTRRAVVENVPLLEKYEFTPYMPEHPLPSQFRVICDKYVEICSIEVKKMSTSDKSVKGSNTSDLFSNAITWENSPRIHETSTLLLNTLQEITQVEDHKLIPVSGLFEKYTTNVGKDVLYNSLFDEYHIRIILEIIRENSSPKMSAIEMCNGHSPILNLMMETVEKLPHSRLTGSVIHPDPDSLNKEKFQKLSIDLKSSQDKDYVKSVKDRDVIVTSFLFGSATMLNEHVKSLRSMGHDGSFVVFYHRGRLSSEEKLISSICKRDLETQSSQCLEAVLEQNNLVVVSKFSDNHGNNLYLLRYKNVIVQENNIIVRVKTGAYEEWVEALKQASETSFQNNAKIWLVAEDSAYNGVVGLMKCLLQEMGRTNLRCIFIIPDESGKKVPPFDVKEPFYKDVIKRDLVFNVYRKVWGSFRHTSLENVLNEAVVPHSFINISKYGDLSSFRWYESPYKQEVDGTDGVKDIVHVVFSALNFRDIMLATGKISSSLIRDDVGNDPCVIGMEFSGINAKGQRVMGLRPNRAIATTIYQPAQMIFDVPDHWTLEDAATVPIVYITSYYALLVKAQLSEGETVLIHSGAGGVGIAAIRIARSLNCEVFTTVGTDEKKKYLKTLFPELKEENIGCSHDTSFELMIKKRTQNRGVDVVLNSLADDKLQASTRCLAEGGRFVEIGKYDLAKDSKIGLGMFLKGATFYGVYGLGKMVKQSEIDKIRKHMYDGIAQGVVQPLDRVVFSSDAVEEAFRFMAGGKHKGKVLLKIRNEPEKGVVPKLLTQHALPGIHFFKRKVYIVIGGLGGFGMELVQWLILKGAVNIIITSRTGNLNGFQKLNIKRWKSMGANIDLSLLNVGKKDEAEKLLRYASSLGPIGGIFNSAVVLQDAFVGDQNADMFRQVCLPKAEATINLDELTRVMCPSLDFFVCFSSISCGKGNAGQSNYGYANSVMERVCEKRRRDKLHGQSIQWGIIGDVGVVHRNMGEDAVISGVMAQPIKSCLDTLGYFMLLNEPVVTSYVNAKVLKKEEREDLLTVIAKAMGYASSIDLDTSRTFVELGIDSISGVEIIQTLESNYDFSMTVRELQEMKISDLQSLVQSTGKGKVEEGHGKTAAVACVIDKRVKIFADEMMARLNDHTDGSPVFFIHYSAENLEKFRAIANFVEFPCYSITCNRDTPINNIRDMADSYLKIITVNSGTFANLVSYSDAATLALEIVSRAEVTPETPHFYSHCIIDGALKLANALTNQDNSGDRTAQEIESLMEFLENFFSTDDIDKIHKELEAKYPRENANCIRNMSSINMGKMNVDNMIDSAKRWIEIQTVLRSYRLTKKCKSNILVVEGLKDLLANDIAFVKSEISKITDEKFELHRIPGNASEFFEVKTARKIANLLNGAYGR